MQIFLSLISMASTIVHWSRKHGERQSWQGGELIFYNNYKGSLQNKFSVKVGILAQPAWPPPLPERWDFFREFVEIFRQNMVKYALKTVI